MIARCAQWLADAYAYLRWANRAPFYATWADFRRNTAAVRAVGRPVYTSRFLGWLGDP